MPPRSLTKAGVNPFLARLEETAERLHKLDFDLLFLRVQLRKAGHGTIANSQIIDLRDLAKAAQDLFKISRVTHREGPKLCTHFAAALRRRHTLWEKRQAAPEAAAAAFPQFAKLPAELRLMIWEAAAVPPSCLHMCSFLAAARKPTRAEEREGLTRMRYAHDADTAGWLLLGDMGLWEACSESRRVAKRVHDRAYRRLTILDRKQYPYCKIADHSQLEKHGRRLNRLNRAAIKFLHLSNSVYWSSLDVCRAEHALRTEPLAQTQTRQEMDPTQVEIELAQRPPNAILQDLLRCLFAFDGDLPQGAHDGPISIAALGLFRKELQLSYILGFRD